jgi:DNA-binding FadR family transcriptional regulator
LKAGEKLPASKEIEQAAGVSRTVVRESVAILKAEGLLISRQGVGVFVTERKNNKLFSIEEAEFNSIDDAIKILELRMAVEIEMAGMAAIHHTQKQLAHINACLEAVNLKLAAGLNGQKEDFDFHLAIANASANHYFTRFIKFIGSGVIPAREIVIKHDKQQQPDTFFEMIRNEHKAIADAIAARDAQGARDAVSAHLGMSRERHIRIAENLKQSES